MVLRVAVTLTAALALAACSSAPPPKPAPAPFSFTGKAEEAAVGERMVNHRAVTVTETPFVGRSKPSGTREAFTYLGLLPADASGKTIRVRYERWKIVDDVESPTVDERAEIRLDLSRGDVITHRTWRIGIVEADGAHVRFVAVQAPP